MGFWILILLTTVFCFFLEEKGGGWREGGVCYVLFMTQSIANNSIAVNMMQCVSECMYVVR